MSIMESNLGYAGFLFRKTMQPKVLRLDDTRPANDFLHSNISSYIQHKIRDIGKKHNLTSNPLIITNVSLNNNKKIIKAKKIDNLDLQKIEKKSLIKKPKKHKDFKNLAKEAEKKLRNILHDLINIDILRKVQREYNSKLLKSKFENKIVSDIEILEILCTKYGIIIEKLLNLETKPLERMSTISKTFSLNQKSIQNGVLESKFIRKEKNFFIKSRFLPNKKFQEIGLISKFDNFFGKCNEIIDNSKIEKKIFSTKIDEFKTNYSQFQSRGILINSINSEHDQLSDKAFLQFRSETNFKKKLIDYLLDSVPNKSEILSIYLQSIEIEESIKKTLNFI